MLRAPITASLVLTLLLLGCGVARSHYESTKDHGPRCAAINGADASEYVADRAPALRRIAEHPDLSEHEQLFLIDVATDGNGFSSDTADLLMLIAGMPYLTKASRARMIERLDHAGLFPGDKRRVAAALGMEMILGSRAASRAASQPATQPGSQSASQPASQPATNPAR
jgi:hypothetical protein